MSHGCASQSMPIVTAYDTLGQEGLQHSLVQTGAKAVFLNSHLIKNLTNPLKADTKIKYVIYTTETPPKQEDLDSLKSTHPELTVISYDELMELGRANPVEPVLPDREDLCCIMYTSGSTGTPKGVPLLHRNVVAAGRTPLEQALPRLLTLFRSCWCHYDRRTPHHSWRLRTQLPPLGAHLGARLRELHHRMGSRDGLRKPSNFVRQSHEELQG